MFGDEVGLFWETPPRIRTKSSTGPRQLPPIPETDWQLPTEFPSLQGQGCIAIDVETFDPDLLERGPGTHRDARLVGVAVGTEAGFRAYYPIDHEIGPNLPANQVLEWLNVQLQLPVPKIGAHLLYDLEFLAAAGVKVAGPFYDVQVAEPLIDETRLTYNLESLARKYLDEGKKESIMSAWLTRAFGDEENIKSNIWRAPASIVGPYAIGDVDLPLRIFAKQKPQLEALALWDLFIMESKLIPMLLAMRQRGVRVDLPRAEEMYKALSVQQDQLISKIKLAASVESIDLWAAESLAQIFDKLKLQYPRTAKTRAPSFRREWLEQHEHPVANLIKEVRGLDKLKETFIKGYILEGHTNGRIYCQFHQLRTDDNGTVSGRFASSHPNLQNIPIRTAEGKLIRQAFLADEEKLWWKFDWSQIEYRLIVHYAALLRLRGAKDVVDKYTSDPDVDYHQIVADMTGLPRYQAKTLNFGLAYGQGVWLLCRNLGVDFYEGDAIIRDYHKRAPFIRPLLQTAMRRANQQGEIKTLLGRRRRFNMWERVIWDPIARKNNTAYFPERVTGSRRAFTHKALNALIQGSAADVMKKAMVQIWESGICNVLGAPHLTVHDELDGSTDQSPQANEALKELKHIMQTCVKLLVPLRADGGIGPNWGATDEKQMSLL